MPTDDEDNFEPDDPGPGTDNPSEDDPPDDDPAPPRADPPPPRTANSNQRLVALPRRRGRSKPTRTAPPTATEPSPTLIPTNPPAAAPAPAPVPIAPSPQPAAPEHPVDGNVLFAFEETLKVFPSAASCISVERKTGTPAQWMLADRPRTANELYAAIYRLHGRREETTYEVRFKDAAGRGASGTISMPSTLDQPLPPGAPAAAVYPYAPAPGYAPPPVAPPLAAYAPAAAPPAFQPAAGSQPFDANALLAMQRQLFDMMQALQPKPPVGAVTPAMPPPPAPGTDVNGVLAMQKQLFEMIQAMQAGVAPQVAAPPAPTAPATQPAQDPMASTLLMMKQLFEMMQAMQAGVVGSASARSAPAQAQPVAAASDPTSSMVLMMQKQMFDMMLAMVQTAQRGPVPPGASPYLRPRYGGDPRDPNAPPPYGPPPRPRSPSQELRDAASMMRETFSVAREIGAQFGGGPDTEPPPEDDDSPVRVIDMGPAKGVINRHDGTLRGVETVMANLPDILKWVGEQRAAVSKARAEREDRDRRQNLPPGYVELTPGYEPPPGYVAVPVDQVPAGDAPEPLQEPPADMPPPIDPVEPKRRANPWGMPPTRS